MAFHRLNTPIYFGGLPGGYDYINNAASGTPALTDGALAAGPNVGSYFVGYKDDGTSANANRPHSALAENTDFLDNLLHRDLAVPTSSSLITSAGDTTFVAGTNIFVGVAGTPNTPAGILTFAKIVDVNGSEVVIESSGAVCQVASISGGTVGGVWAGGPVTFNISPTIPSGVQYRIIFGIRGNLATLPADAITNLGIRYFEELPTAFLDFRRQIARLSGLNVAALIATRIETPDGVRLPKNNGIQFNVDPDGAVGFQRNVTISFQTSQSVWKVYETIPTADTDLYPVGVRYIVDHLNGGLTVFRFNSNAGLVTSALRTAFNSGINHSGPYFPFTENAAGNTGANLMRLFERPALVDSAGNPTGDGTQLPSLMRMLNARPFVTVGDGTNSFGDFNGSLAIQNALSYYRALVDVPNKGLTIFVKPGNYTINNPPFYGGDIKILGASKQRCVITVASSGGGSFGNSPGDILTLENLTMQGNASLTTPSFMQAAGTLIARNVDFIRYNFVIFNPGNGGGAQTNSPYFLLEKCRIDAGSFGYTAAGAVFEMIMGDGAIHTGFIVRDSVILSMDSSPMMRISAQFSGISLTQISDVIFQRCTILLRSTTNTTNGNGMAVLAANSGVLEIVPQGSVNRLQVDNIVFEDCDVTANSAGTGTNSILAHILPIPRGNVGTTYASNSNLGRVTIRRGRWVCIPNGSGSNVGPLFIVANNITVEGTEFVGTGLVGGNAPVEAQALLADRSVIAQADWSQFVFGAGGAFVPAAPAGLLSDPTITISNVNFTRFARASSSGDVSLYLPFMGKISNIRFSSYFAGGGGSAPTHRLFMQGVEDVGTMAEIENIVLKGANDSSDFVSTSGSSGIVMFKPNSLMRVRNLTITGFTKSSGRTGVAGGSLYIPNSGVSQATGLTLENFNVDQMAFGFFAGNVSGIATPVNALRVLGGFYTNNDYGIYIATGNFHDAEIRGVRSFGNGNQGILVSTGSWGTLTCVDNRLYGNNGSDTAVQMSIIGSTGATPKGICRGNDLSGTNGSASFGLIHYEQNGGATSIRGVTEKNHQLVKMRGLEVGTWYDTTDASSGVSSTELRKFYQDFGSGSLVMSQNVAGLNTP
jgi:hypothetical protein